MPTSVPGTSSLRRIRVQSPNSRGFTLIEVLVVLLVMGLLAGLVGAIARPDDRALLRVEAERLAQLLDLAALEARLTGDAIAWTADPSGYRFSRMNAEGERFAQWSEIRDGESLRPRALPQGMLLASLQVENMPARRAMRLEFAPFRPAYSYAIEMSLGAARYTVAASPVGEVRAVPREGN